MRTGGVLLVVVAVALTGGAVGAVGVDAGGAAAPASAPGSTEMDAGGTDRIVRGTATGTTAPDGTNRAPRATGNGTLEVHFIDVGQSASTLIVGPTGETILIDTGHFRDDGEQVLRYLRSQGIERIDALVVSHNDADHIGGNAAVIEYFETEANGIGAVYDPGIAAGTETYGAYLDAVEAYDVPLYETRAGDPIPLAGANVSVLGPPEPYLDGEARNENNVVLRVGYGNTSFLFPGDAEDDQERQLVETYGDRLNATVLQAGHHGSATSTGDALLDAVSPRAVVISSAYDSQYGHPDVEVLDRLANRSIPTYWTATHGDVVMVSNGSAVTVRTRAAAPTDPARLREGEPADSDAGGAVETRAVIPVGGASTHPPTPSESSAPDASSDPDASTPDESSASTGTAETTAVPDGGTGGGVLALADVHADAAGDEYDNLNDEYLVLENTGDETLDLSGWTVTDAADHTYTFPEGTTLAPGARLTLHTGEGTDTATDVYWGSDAPVWNNAGDAVTVRNDDGDAVLEEEYE